MTPLAEFEEIIDASGVAPRIEAMLPIGVRPRQLTARALLAGMCLAQAGHRPAHLTRVHQALTALSEDDQRRLGVIADWKHGPHLLTYRQTERTFGLVADALAGNEPGGLPSGPLQAVCDGLLEASVPDRFTGNSRSMAVDWTDLESFSRPPPHGTCDCADPEASWGHRKNNLLRREDELFYGYYLSAGVMMPEETGPAVPELARRATLSSCRHDPVRAFAPVLTAMPGQGIPLGDILDDSGYAHRDASAWAIPLRAAGARLVQDLHPHDRGPKGTHDGAIIANGNLYCPRTPVNAMLRCLEFVYDLEAEKVAVEGQHAGWVSCDDPRLQSRSCVRCTHRLVPFLGRRIAWGAPQAVRCQVDGRESRCPRRSASACPASSPGMGKVGGSRQGLSGGAACRWPGGARASRPAAVLRWWSASCQCR
jgi:hypothetical protein